MITIFNRRELINTSDMKRHSEIRSLLALNGIDYIVNVLNMGRNYMHGRNTIMGTFGANMEFSYMYKIYVRKRDYEYASKLIGVIR